MASVSDEESVLHEESGRRTRSGRKVNTPVTPSTRSTRRTSRKQNEQVSEPDSGPEGGRRSGQDNRIESGIIQEMLAEAAQGVLQSSNRRDEDLVIDLVESEEVVGTQESTELLSGTQGSEFDMLATPDEIGNLHHSLRITSIDQPMTNYDLSQNSDGFVPQTQELDEMFGTQPEQEHDEVVVSTQEAEENMAQAEDEKSCSFPFGDIPPSDNSDGKAEDATVTNINDCVDSSLLASLVGDNANSLPSVDEESQSKENFEQAESEKAESIKISLDDASQSEPAIAEDLPNGEDRESQKTSADIEAELVSEDELPTPTKPKVTDAEEVSDDELPGPAQAELPADTEVVSEDELPTPSKKEAKRKASEGYDPSSPTGESGEVPEKKTKLSSEEREETKERKKEKRKLPDLDKYWSAVNDDPADFTGWTYLLQYVDQENDVEAAREAYDAFLGHYPYCYGYWRKYADYEKRKGSKKKCEEVFERGLNAIPLSVDLWIHYLTHVKTNYADDEEYIRSQFDRALAACGLEFRSDKLWEAFIKWETEGKRYSKVLKIYDRLLKTPTQGYSGHFDGFQDLVNNHNVTSLISTEEFKKLRTEVRESDKKIDNDADLLENEPDDHVKNDEEATAIRDRIIAARRKMHKSNVAAVTARWTFEEGIKRPYFHVKPLERCQLKNWNEYLDFEIERGDQKRILILFERCLIACALYDEFWLKLIRYLESQDDPKLIPVLRDAFSRACTIHHPDKPSLHMMWSAFEECQNSFDKAAEILVSVEKVCPNLLQIAYRRINLERRRKDFVKCKELYEHYISQAKNKNISGSLAIKYARFCHKIMNDLEGGLNILRTALEKDPGNTRVALQMIDLAIQRSNVDEKEIVLIMDKFMSRDGMDPEQKVLFAQRKVEFLEDFGSTAKGLQDAQRNLQIALNKANEAKKKSESSPSKKTNAKEHTPTVATNTTSYNNGNYGYGSTNSGYYGNNQSYQGYDSYGYNHWQYGSGYNSGYSQWGGYGNYY